MLKLVQALLPWLGLIAVPLAVLLGLQTLQVQRVQHKLDAETQLYLGSQLALKQSLINYQAAAEQARRADAANKVRVEADQKATTERIERDYQARIADARTRAERLRQQLDAHAPGRPGSPAAAPVPGVPGAPGVADGAAPQGGLPLDDALTATEQALQLDGLQRWIRAQATINYSASSPPSPTASR